MTTIKSYTDIEQSRKLAEFLPLESADMQWIIDGLGEPFPFPVDGKVNPSEEPCWSLTALLNILAKQSFIIKSSERNDEYQYNIDIPIRHCKIWFSSLLDAAFEMVYWLKENNKL